MKKKRLIPVLLLRNGWLVQSKYFREYKNLGNPIEAVKRLSEWASDELIYLDISPDDSYDMRREDLRDPNRHSVLDILEDVSKRTSMPITIGGKIRTLEDIHDRLSRGADKISINTQALNKPEFITQAANEFGSQCVVVSIDVKRIDDHYQVMTQSGSVPTEHEAVAWAKAVESYGAGEILLNSVDQDGAKDGFELPIIQAVAEAVSLPVIACGGAGEWSDFGAVFDQTKADAVAAANVFQHIDQSVYLAKKYLYEHNYPVRPPSLLDVARV
jgi:imidazole glycerol-phosphate synthase subunit HisF